MGYDDGRCEVSPSGEHEFRRDALVVTQRGQLDQLHLCRWCNAPAYDASDDPAARPPL